jgi:MGT family glycosyltransferase
MTELAARGHQSAVYTLADERQPLAQAGIEAWPVDSVIESSEIGDWRERSLIRNARSVLRTFTERASVEAPDLKRAIDRHDPDVLLIDINCWGAAIAAEASKRPWAIYSPYLPPLPSRDAPPFGLGLAPMQGALGTLRDELVRRVTDQTMDRLVMPSLAKLRARRGLPTVDHFSDLPGRAPLLLALTAEGFEYPRRDWPANVRLVGPINWGPLQEAPTWLASMPEPLVLVTCSSDRQGDERLIEVPLEALPTAGMSVIATTAAHDPSTFDTPPGARVVRFLPHEPVLNRAACVVCHGGLGITQKALTAGVPVVVVPFGRDQLETARRVEFAEAGVRLSPRRLSPARLTKAVRTAIDRRAGAERVSRIFRAAGGQAAAAAAIEAIGRGAP